ncbi:MAG TPA: translocation/assembly module TamB domain-containing protein [Burkholderiaceae bacterium]|nr:translocation/assembly module TamB domain-containing protein [Burkholderiaceae bacterium]
MADLRPDPASPPPAPPGHRPPWLTSLVLVLVPATALVITVWLGIAWLSGTSAGLRTLLWGATWAIPSLQASGVSGSLQDGFTLERLVIDEPRWSFDAANVTVTPEHLDWTARSIDLANVSARSASVTWAPGEKTERPQPPASLALPWSLRLRNVAIGELRLGERGTAPQVLRDLRLQGEAGRDSIRIERASARYGVTDVVVTGTVGTARPFPLTALAEVRSHVLDNPVQATIDASGSLVDMTLAAKSDNEAGRIDAQARLTPFDAVPLAALALTVADFEPQRWVSGLPTMKLAGSAQLQPQPGPTFTLAGPFKVANALAGPVDSQRLPVQSARGTLRWSASALDLVVEQVEGAGGTARGGVVRSADGSVTAEVSFSAIDAARIHTAMTPTRASGTLDYRFAQGVQRFSGSAGNAKGVPLKLDFAVELADGVLDIQKALARVGEGRADITGHVRLGKETAAQLKGEFHTLDLSQFVAGMDTRLNGHLTVDGTLQPVRRGRAEVTLSDSRLYGRPLEGHATLRLDGELFDVDTELKSGAAHLHAKGGLGAGRELAFDLVSPRLGDLLPALGGSVTAQGTISGPLSAPSLVASASASALLLPNQQRIEKLDASLRGGLAPDAPLDVNVTLSGHRTPGRPELWIATATLTARGTTSAHAIALDATTAAKEPLAMRASGGWQKDAWRGSVTSLVAGKPFDLRLETAAPVTIAADRVAVGPTAFTARDTRFADAEFARAEGRSRSSGTFANLQPQAFDPRARAPRRAVRTTDADPHPLTLAGRWSLEYGSALNGVVVVERTSGDLYSGVDAVHPIGISDIGAALNIVDNRVNGTAYLRGRALGKVDAVIDAYIDPQAMRLAQDRRFRVNLDATLPDLGWVGPLISDTVQVQGAATVQAVVGGTPGDPTADGKVQGRDLRLVWIEQGLRLENGRLDAALQDGVLILNEMTFTGDARVPPDEKRALGALTSGTGTLKVVGRVAVQTLTGSIGVTADRLPILQRRDRWMVVSGEGGITLTPTRAELYAKPTVDGAYISFAARGPRTLPSDVVVVRQVEAQKAKEASPPMEVSVNVEARLGQRFYIRGAGLEARVAGGLTVTGRPTQLQAVGTVRILDGIYNGYGQRLQIERGLVTFSGPLENPALNVLAVRPGLPVEVGVQITGTALAPIVRLQSDTAMSDVEKLNWLVLGRPPGTGESQDRALLTAAASALFAGQSDGAASNLMRSLGIDEFGLRTGGQSSSSLLPRESVAGTLRSGSSSTASGDFVALGKRLTDELYVTFEQALSGAEYYVALNYQLTRRFSVIARAGSTNAIDLVYSLSFDKWSEAFESRPSPGRAPPRSDR